jgi:hypothetical protein
VDDAGAPPAGDARAVLAALDPALADDGEVVAAVAAHAEELDPP